MGNDGSGQGNVLIAVLEGIVGAVLVAVGAEIIREFCVTVPSEKAAMLSVAAWVLCIISGFIVAIPAVSGFAIVFRKGAKRGLVLGFTVFLLAAWIFLPLSPYVADIGYNLFSDYDRLSSDRAEELAESYCGLIFACAEERGDIAKLDGADAERPSLVGGMEIDVLSSDGKCAVELKFTYDERWDRLTVGADFEIRTRKGQTEDIADELGRALGFFNRVARRPYTVAECLDTAENQAYAEYAWDGSLSRLNAFSGYEYIRVNVFEAYDGEEEYDICSFALRGLGATAL